MHSQQACFLNTLLFLHSVFMLCMVKMPLKGVVGGRALNGHVNYIVNHGKSWKNHGIVFLNFCGNHGPFVICSLETIISKLAFCKILDSLCS